MKKGLTEIVFILDRSGSMGGLEADTIGGYNSMLERQKAEEGEAILSTVLFDDRTEVLHDRKKLQEISPMTDKEYYVRGCTALLDAVGGAIHHIGRVHKHSPEEEVPEKTLFIITTDGMENASRHYTYDKVKRMVEKKKEKHQWEFIFLGANIDAIDVANRFGIAKNRAVRYESDSMGHELNYEMMSKIVGCARSAASPKAMSAMMDADESLDRIRTDYEEYQYFSSLDTEEEDVSEDLRNTIEDRHDELTVKEQTIIDKLLGLRGEKKRSYSEVSKELGVSEGRVRQTYSKAIRKMSSF